MKELLEQIRKFQEEDIDDDIIFDKCEGEIKEFCKVEVQWGDREESDYGYSFILPHQDSDIGDVCIHMTEVDNSDGIDAGDPVWIHIYDLTMLPRVKKVIFTPSK